MSEHHTRQLTAYRRAHDLTQEDLAELLNVSAATISRWESLAQSPDPEHIAMIENLLGLQRLNSCEEWRFRVTRSLGYEVLFDERGNVVATSQATLALSGLTPEKAFGLKTFELLPAPASTEAEAEYRRLDFPQHRALLFARQIRLIKLTADLNIPNFSTRISGDYWPILTSSQITYALFTFLPIGRILDPNWNGAYRILTYQVFPLTGLQTMRNAVK